MNASDHKRGRILVSIIPILMLWIYSGPANAQSATPDNAAFLYYQACLLRSTLPGEPDELWFVESGDRDPGNRVRQFVRNPSTREVIELANAATELPSCDWGAMASKKWRVGIFAISLRPLAGLLSIDARVQAVEGHYVPAFETALRLRRFAKHVGDEVYTVWTISLGLDAKAFSLIQYVLDVMPPDVDTLTWLKSQLAHVEGSEWRPREALQSWRDMELVSWRESPEEFMVWKDEIVKTMTDETASQELEALTQDELLEHMRAAYDIFMESALEILESDRSYQAKRAQIEQLIDRTDAECSKGNPITFMTSCTRFVAPYYRLHANAEAQFNAVKAALEVYLIRAKTGRIPQNLPDGLPGDPYSGEGFEYQITEEGFSLHCRVSVPEYSHGPRQFDFKVRHKEKD